MIDYLWCLSWEMKLNVGLGVSFNNMYDYEGMREKVEEVNSTEVSLKMMPVEL